MDKFSDVFKTTEGLKEMKGPPMKIHLKENYEPFKITAARPIPFA